LINSPLQSNKQDLSKIEAGKTTLNPKDFDLHRLLDIKFCQIFLMSLSKWVRIR